MAATGVAPKDSAAAGSAPAAASCFHCGLPLREARHTVVVDGITQDTCCRGCQAVAEAIVDGGLDAYYRNRAALPLSPRGREAATARYELYDLPALQAGFVRDVAGSGNEKEAALLLEGMTCGACVWLIEQRLARINGVRAATVNFATRRARVRWDAGETRLSDILAAVAALGYSAVPYDAARAEDALQRERRAMLWRLAVAGLGMMQVMMYAVPAYLADGAMTGDIEQLMRIASLLLTAPVIIWSAVPFYRGALRDLLNRSLGMDVPVTLGILVAFGASAVATLRGSGEVYYDSVTMFVFLLLAARYLDLVVRGRALSAQESLLHHVPAVAERLDDPSANGFPVTVPSAALRPGDHVLIRPGASVPVDGVVVDGSGATDESLLTGESRPVSKRIGDPLTGGAVNLHGPLVMRVERVGEDTVLSGIVRLMDRALGERPPIATAAERAARVFVAAQLLVTLVVAGIWYWIDPAQVLPVAVALLVVTCPCALSLATPTALTAAAGTLYRDGLLVGRGHAVEALARADFVVFDKTGTLTDGRMSVVGVIPLHGERPDSVLAWAASLEAGSEHPIGRAIVVAAGKPVAAADSLRHEPGLGIEGCLSGRRMRIGRPEFVAALHGEPLPVEWLFVSDSVTAVAVGDARGWVGLITLGDQLRPDARRVVSELAAQGKTVCLLSGDRGMRVDAVGRELGIRICRGDATPADKQAFVRRLQDDGSVVAMVGDGVNDAPVLAQSQVSIALGRGTDLAKRHADIVLVGDRLAPLSAAFATAQRSLRVVRQNLAWAMVYNALAIPLAAGGYITPLWAAIGMSASSMLVVANALRLYRAPRGGRRPVGK